MTETYLNLPTKSSSAADWQAWYDILPNQLSKKEKNFYFLEMWKKNGSDNANTHALRSAMEDNGIKLETGVSGTILDVAEKPIDFMKGVFKFGAVGGIIIGGASLIFVGLIIYRLATPQGVGTVIKYAK